MSPSVVIVEYGRVEEVDHSLLAQELAQVFSREAIVGVSRPVPASGFNKSRNQQLAGSFLGDLRLRAVPQTKYLGVTAVDLYSRGLNLVFGQADVGGTAAVISLARLHPEGLDGAVGVPELLRERVLKEAIHELDHAFGMIHCRDKYCIMHFSRSLPDTDIKGPGFCYRHESELPASQAD